MFNSLRSRLWLSYALLIITALLIVAAALLIYLFRNPILYRQAIWNLTTAQNLITVQDDKLLNTDMDKTGELLHVRLLLFSANRELIYDTQSGTKQLLGFPRATLLRKAPIVRDANGAVWLYTFKQLPDQTWLMTATPRPKVSALGFLADELILPFVQGGLIALLLSLIVAYLIARWIADPLQGMVTAARQMPSDEIKLIESHGPHEVQVLTRAFNAMVARLQASQRSQREFVANVSHELKTPLTSIQGFAQALLDGTAENPSAREQAAQIIYDESGRMHRMVLGLLDLARLDSGIANINMTLMDVAALIKAIVDKFEPLAQKAGVKLVIQTADHMPLINGDGDRLAQVFMNLVENALKHTPRGGMITLRIAVVLEEMCISVIDTGAGIPIDALPHIFERFYQVDSSRKAGENQSAGLGLAIAHQIIHAQGGRISAHSKVGEGSTFVVYLPLSSSKTTILRKQ